MDMFHAGIAQFKEKRKDGDLDLITEVRNLLIQSGLHINVSSAYDSNQKLMIAKDKIAVVQRQYLNDFWTIQLLTSTVPTQEIRFCLVPNGEPLDWLKLFKDKVLPVIISENLPRVIN